MPTWVCSHEIPIEHWCWPTKHQWRGNFPKGMLGVTMFAKAKLQLEFVRWTGPRCAAVTDIQGDTPGPKKDGFLHGKTGPVPCSLDGSSIMRWFVPSTLGFIHFSTHPRSVWSDDPVALWDRFTMCLKPCGFLSQQNADDFRSASFGCFPAKASHNLHQSPYPGWCFARHLLS